ncbi:MAG: hypothetical protein Q9163_000249 [Psora crenata]
MEVIVRNLHEQITERQVESYFRPYLERFGIRTFHCKRHQHKGWALLTFAYPSRGHQFLLHHGQSLPGARGFTFVKDKLYRLGRPIYVSLSKNVPDQFLLLSLEKQESDRHTRVQSQKPKITSSAAPKSKRAFDLKSLACGQWDYVDEELIFAIYSQEFQPGRGIFGPQSMFIKLGSSQTTLHPGADRQIEIPYYSVDSLTVGSQPHASITFALSESPKFYERVADKTEQKGDALADAFSQLLCETPKSAVRRRRITSLGKTHQKVVASCLCYRLFLANPSDIAAVRALKRFKEIPEIIFCNTSVFAKTPFPAQMTTLNDALTGETYSRLPFDLKFQLQKLAQNGYLSPLRVVELLAQVNKIVTDTNAGDVIDAIRRLFGQLPFPGPNTEPWELSVEHLVTQLQKNQQSVARLYAYGGDLAAEYDHIINVHKAMVTPSGIYLFGPEPEIKNRVLRKYADFPNYFLSVSFLGEDGEPLRHDRHTSNDEIFQVRFKQVLEGIINVAGRGYEV